MNTKELRDKIGQSSFNAIIKHPYYKEHIYSSMHDAEFHHETTPSGSHSTIKAHIPFGGKKKTITFQYHKNKVYNAHYALDDKHIRSHKEVKESMENINELSAKTIQSYLNKLKAKKRAEQEKKEPVTEAKIGDKVTVTHGSQKGLVGHVGEIRKGLGGSDHTYTVDYDDNGKRASVQVKKAHTKVIKEASIHSSYMAGRGKSGMRAKAPNASDKPDFGTYHVTVKHEGGEKTYKLKNMKEPKHAMNTAQKIHRTDNPEHKIKDVTYKKLDEENIFEVSKRLLGRYIEKAATSMSAAAFGQGQASASRRPPSEKDQKTGMNRMTGIARATSKLTKEEAEQVDELNQMTLSRYAATARVKAMNKNDPKREKRAQGNATANRKLKFGDYSEETISELNKSTLNSYLDKTVDPVHGMPRSAEKLPQRVKGIERATKKILGKKPVGEQHESGMLTINDKKLKQTRAIQTGKRQRERFVSKKNSEEHRTHLGIHKADAKAITPHIVSVTMGHKEISGPIHKKYKVKATSPDHATDLVSNHFTNKGFKVSKVHFAEPFKQEQHPTPYEAAKEKIAKEKAKAKVLAAKGKKK